MYIELTDLTIIKNNEKLFVFNLFGLTTKITRYFLKVININYLMYHFTSFVIMSVETHCSVGCK